MSSIIIMPQLGETVEEGKILTWFKAVGDDVREGDNLFEVETDKVTMEVQAVVTGRLTEIRVGNGDIAKVGDVVAVVGGAPAGQGAPPSASVVEKANHRSPDERSPFEEVSTPSSNFGGAKWPGEIRVTPRARRIAAQNGLDLGEVALQAGAANGKRLGEREIREVLANRAATASAAPALPVLLPTLPTPSAPPPGVPTPIARGGAIFALNTIRQRTGEQLAESWRTIPHVFQAIEVDFTRVEGVRGRHKETFRAAHGVSLTYLPFIARATCIALHAFPQINARLDGNSLLLSRDVNLGVAVDLDHNGLVAPVVRNAGDLTLTGLVKAMARQIEKARSGQLTGDDFAGGTYSISNNGAFGTSFTAPIINAPQVAILSVDAIRKKPAIVSTPQGDFVVPQLTGTLGQSFDHRAFDGAYSAAFLSRLKQIIEDRNWEEEFS